LTDPCQHPCRNRRQATQDAQSNQALFSTEKTASVHVRHLLAKLESPVRSEATAIAHRLHLDQR
jgi:DNA-binding NarL/FixJ family response regulator